MIAVPVGPLAALGVFGDAIEYIFQGGQSETAGREIGGPSEILELTATHLEVTGLAMLVGIVIALPAGVLLGHFNKGELAAIAIGNAGRALPELAVIAFLAIAIGVGLRNVVLALAILAIPPILTNSFVAIRQVEPSAVQAARGVGMTTLEVITKVELPLAVPTIMSGIRTSTINVVATATLGPLAGVLTLGDLILRPGLIGQTGVVAGAICVAILALTLELALAGVQRFLTPAGLRLGRAAT
jgi:osmoprotectant transport system permease protein